MQTKVRYLYRAYVYRWRVDPAELRFLCRRLHPGQVAVDVGCHKGAYTYWMQRSVGPQGTVLAFEPQPRQVEYLRQAFAAMHYRNVTLEPKGLSDAPGRLPLHIAKHAGGTHGASFTPRKASGPAHDIVEVDVTTLDACFAGRPRGPDLVKIDVEGYELAVLTGSRQTLAMNRPIVMVECESRHYADGDMRPVFDFFKTLGYEGSFFLGGQRRPLSEFDAAVHQRRLPGVTKPPPGYANNFAFVHRAAKSA